MLDGVGNRTGEEFDRAISDEHLKMISEAVSYTHLDVYKRQVQHNLMLMDLLMYHPDDILVKVDRTAMAVSLESRVPMLDKDVVEFAWSLPVWMKWENGRGKLVLRDVYKRQLLDMDTYLPGDILCKVDRASMKYSLEARCPILDQRVICLLYTSR